MAGAGTGPLARYRLAPRRREITFGRQSTCGSRGSGTTKAIAPSGAGGRLDMERGGGNVGRQLFPNSLSGACDSCPFATRSPRLRCDQRRRIGASTTTSPSSRNRILSSCRRAIAERPSVAESEGIRAPIKSTRPISERLGGADTPGIARLGSALSRHTARTSPPRRLTAGYSRSPPSRLGVNGRRSFRWSLPRIGLLLGDRHCALHRRVPLVADRRQLRGKCAHRVRVVVGIAAHIMAPPERTGRRCSLRVWPPLGSAACRRR
jgi:hypothetical protein